MPVNPSRSLDDELPLWAVGPQIQQQGEPLGGLLALLAALYEPDIRAVAVCGGLISFTSILDDAFAYVPADIALPGFLEAGDLADLEAVIAPRPLLLENLINGKNRTVGEPAARDELRPVSDAYRAAHGNFELRADQQPSSIAEWLVGHL